MLGGGSSREQVGVQQGLIAPGLRQAQGSKSSRQAGRPQLLTMVLLLACDWLSLSTRGAGPPV